MKDMGQFVFEGAFHQTGADAKLGVTIAEVVSFLTQDGGWE